MQNIIVQKVTKHTIENNEVITGDTVEFAEGRPNLNTNRVR